MSTHPVEILIKNIKTDPLYYPRFQPDLERIKEFVEAMECGEHFPPIKVAKDEAKGFYMLLDGKHRLEAKKLRGEEKIAVDVFPIQKAHWLMAAARFNSKSSKPLQPDEIKQIIIGSWHNGIKDTDEIAREMGRTVRYVEMVLKPIRDEERNKREEKILDLHQQGMSQRQIASEIGLSLCCINITLKSNEENNNESILNPNEDIPGTPDEVPGVDQVFYKRNDFVFRTPCENNNINILNGIPEKSSQDSEKSTPINPMKGEPDEGFNDETFLNPNEDISGAIFESHGTPDEDNHIDELNIPPEKSGLDCELTSPINSTERQLDTPSATDKVFPKRSNFVLETLDENYHINELDIQTQKSAPDCEIIHCQNSIQTSLPPSNSGPYNNTDHTQKTTRYPSYLDQIDFYRELPVQSQHAIRVMELAKKYKMDIIDMVKEIDEPVIWIRKVLVAAMALSLMRGDKLDDASSVETLIGISFDIARCIQSALPFQTMLCPISPDMEQWAKDNLSPKDLDLILSLVEVNKNDLPHLLKGETPPKKTNCFKALPDCYKDQLQTSIAVLRELRDHAKNKRFNGDSAKQLLSHLNKNVMVINEIVDGLREGKLL